VLLRLWGWQTLTAPRRGFRHCPTLSNLNYALHNAGRLSGRRTHDIAPSILCPIGMPSVPLPRKINESKQATFCYLVSTRVLSRTSTFRTP
jgi:hypothetical protein